MKFLLKKIWWLILLAIIIIIIIVSAINKSSSPKFEYTTEKVICGDLIQTVEATGSVKPFSTVDLKFQTAGVVLDKNVEIGTRVKKGDALLSLDDRVLKFQMEQAQATLSQAWANLNKTIAGASIQDINVSEKSVDKAYVDYQNAQTNLELTEQKLQKDLITYEENLNKASADLDSAQQNLVDIISTQNQNLDNLNNTTIITMEKVLADCDVALNDIIYEVIEDYKDQFVFSMINQQRINRETAKNSISAAQIKILTTKSEPTNINIDNAIIETQNALDNTFISLTGMYNLLSDESIGEPIQSSLNTYKSSLSTYITTISADISSLQTAQQNILNGRLAKDSQINTAEAGLTSAQNNLEIAQANYDLAAAGEDTQISSAQSQVSTTKAAWEVAKAQLELKKAPAREVDLAPYRAQVQAAQAAYELAEKNWQDNFLLAPITGIVTDIYYEIGEQVTTASPAITLITINDYEIKVDISESDIAKVNLGNKVEITLDAFGDDQIFNGEVTFVNPAQTEIQEVVYYQVTITFDKLDFDIKPGMTANLTIFTDSRQHVLSVPRRAVIEQDGEKIVRVLENNQPIDYQVVTGLKADDGLIEIISGLNENQEVITFVKEL